MTNKHPDIQSSGILSRWRGWRNSASWLQTGKPQALGVSEEFAPPLHMSPIDGMSHYHILRDFDFGAQRFGNVNGQISYNPIGAGVVFTKQLPIEPGAVARVANGIAIFWSVQMQNNALTLPPGGPIYTAPQLTSLLGKNVAQAVVPPPLPGEGFYPGA